MSLQNLKENYLYDLLPAGILELDEKGLLEAVIGGVQDRLEDLRSYAKKYEIFFDTSGIADSNTVVLVTFNTGYGKVVTRSLDVQNDTPSEEGDDLTTWASDQIGVEESLITSCVFGVDLLRFVDINTLQYIAANIGAVLYTTAAQPGTEQSNQQRILESYFPRLKIKGTVQSFDTLGRLLGFDDIRITPLWGRLSPRIPNDFGHPDNDPDFEQTPQFQPQQEIGVAYNPYAMRDGPFYRWSGTVTTDATLDYYYPSSVNGFQPWVKLEVTGTAAHPPIDSTIELSGGAPHVKATALTDYGMKFTALGEGDSFNGLSILFETWNDGTDRLMTIEDRLSAIKYRTSYFDAVLTLGDQRSIEQFGTVASKRSSDLADDPSLTVDGVAQPPYRPWFSGSATTETLYSDYTYKVLDGPSTPVPGDGRSQATSSQTQFNTADIQNAAVQYIQAMDEVKPATRNPRNVSIGWLVRDQASFAAYKEQTLITTFTGPAISTGVASAIGKPYEVSFVSVQNGTTSDIPAEYDLLSSTGSLVNFELADVLSGTFNRSTDSFFVNYTRTGTLSLYANWVPESTEVIRSYNGTDSLTGYQHRPEDESGTATPYETVDEFPWRADLVGGGDLVEVKGHAASFVTEFGQVSVLNSIAVKDHCGVEYNLYGVDSTVEPIRMVSEVKPTGNGYQPGQMAIGYSGGFKSLDSIPASDFLLPGRTSTDLEVYFQPDAELYHVGFAQGVLVADLQRFFAPHHRDGLVGWLPLNEHPDDGAVAADVSSSATTQDVKMFTLTGSFADRQWSDERGWYLYVSENGTVSTDGHRNIDEEYAVSLWIKPDATVVDTGTRAVFQHGPLRLDLPDDKNRIAVHVYNTAGTHQQVATMALTAGQWNNVAVVLDGTATSYGVATLAGALTMNTVIGVYDFMPFEDVGDSLIINSGSNRGFGIQDVRVWNEAKTQADLRKTHDHSPQSTICTYWPANITIVSTGDRYGLKATPAGFVYPDKLPPAVRMNQLARITRYNSMGRYQGEERLKEVGLGGGTTLPSRYVLGQLGYNVFATGTTVVSTQTGAMPGWNPEWNTEQSGTMVLDPMQSTNACRNTIWLSGTDGYVYEVGLVSSGTDAAVLSGTRAESAGAEVLLSNGAYRLTCADNGHVFQTLESNISTPPLFMYLNSRITDDVTSTWERWTAKDTPLAYGNQQTPQVAALNANGQLEFENTSTLQPGNYRLTITSGNIGKVDDDFDGYSVEVSVDTILLVSRLCQGETGADFTATDIIEFEVPETIPANWFLTINWLNAYSNPSKGVARKLRIDSYKVEWIRSELFKVNLVTGTNLANPIITPQVTTTYSPVVAGGWLATLNSYGTVCQWRHESQVYPENDTVKSVVPLSDLLTSNTAERREDIIVSSYTGTNVLIEASTPAMPVFSTPVVS